MGIRTCVCFEGMRNLDKRGFGILKKSEDPCVGGDNSIPSCPKTDLNLDVLALMVSHPQSFG